MHRVKKDQFSPKLRTYRKKDVVIRNVAVTANCCENRWTDINEVHFITGTRFFSKRLNFYKTCQAPICNRELNITYYVFAHVKSPIMALYILMYIIIIFAELNSKYDE